MRRGCSCTPAKTSTASDRRSRAGSRRAIRWCTSTAPGSSRRSHHDAGRRKRMTEFPRTSTTIQADLSPDLILVNGEVVTVDGNFSLAEAVAIKDGRIVGVGAASDIRALAGRRTETID